MECHAKFVRIFWKVLDSMELRKGRPTRFSRKQSSSRKIVNCGTRFGGATFQTITVLTVYGHCWLLYRYRRNSMLIALWAKWPISINFENIWAWNTVCVIISYLPLFGVLELGELEYPLFLVHRGTWPSASGI